MRYRRGRSALVTVLPDQLLAGGPPKDGIPALNHPPALGARLAGGRIGEVFEGYPIAPDSNDSRRRVPR